MTNNVRESAQINLENRTVSVWSDVFEEKYKYLNVFYRPDGPKVLEIDASGMDYTIWWEHFIG